MNEPIHPREGLQALFQLPDQAIDLAQAALLIARDEYPDLELGPYLDRIDGMAATVRARLRGGEGATSRIAHLNRHLFDDLGFRGNVAEYDDPRNSYLNDVLDRRLGIPITLSIVYLAVGVRSGVPLAGVSFPGHFLVRYAGRDLEEDLLIDPFHRGALLTPEQCRRRLLESFGGRIAYHPALLRRASHREILERTLNNLKAGFETRRDYSRALRVQNRMVGLKPDAPEPRRDRGLIEARLALFEQAADDFDAYLAARPAAADSAALRRQTRRLRMIAPRPN
ncbi:MAG TPA: transglutaminase-like domain-containing protein [Candidatus Polarisedimenticolia bacterium]|nr:transglutaminase-like domain-containing protein [Candidatus Polarisedimenticolia bacterium]